MPGGEAGPALRSTGYGASSTGPALRGPAAQTRGFTGGFTAAGGTRRQRGRSPRAGPSTPPHRTRPRAPPRPPPQAPKSLTRLCLRSPPPARPPARGPRQRACRSPAHRACCGEQRLGHEARTARPKTETKEPNGCLPWFDAQLRRQRPVEAPWKQPLEGQPPGHPAFAAFAALATFAAA